MGESRVKIIPISRWVLIFLGAQFHKWIKQRFHESHGEMAEHLARLPRSMSGTSAKLETSCNLL